MEINRLNDTAFIVRNFIGAKRKSYYEYKFFVEGQEYNGFLNYSPSQGEVAVGVSFLVKYHIEQPEEINMLITEKNH